MKTSQKIEVSLPLPELGNVMADEHEPLVVQVDEHLPDDFSHVHAADHLLEDLLARVDGSLVHASIPLGDDIIQLSLIAKCSPFCIDDNMFGFIFVSIS